MKSKDLTLKRCAQLIVKHINTQQQAGDDHVLGCDVKNHTVQVNTQSSRTSTNFDSSSVAPGDPVAAVAGRESVLNTRPSRAGASSAGERALSSLSLWVGDVDLSAIFGANKTQAEPDEVVLGDMILKFGLIFSRKPTNDSSPSLR